MLFTVTMLVLLASIAVFFSQEFGKLYKKYFAIRAVKLFVPLILVSWVFEEYQTIFLWLLTGLQSALAHLIDKLATLLPFKLGAVGLIQILCLFVIGCLPEWTTLLRKKLRKKKIRHHRHHHHHHEAHLTVSFRLGVILWVILVILFSAPIYS